MSDRGELLVLLSDVRQCYQDGDALDLLAAHIRAELTTAQGRINAALALCEGRESLGLPRPQLTTVVIRAALTGDPQ